MKYTDLPGTDERVSVIGLGTWVFGGENWGGADNDEAVAVVKEAIGLGVNFIDTAPFYTDGVSEELIGKGIAGKRDKVFIATKCGLVRENGRIVHDLTPGSLERELELSLKRLQCDVIDLYQTHWPDPNVEIERTMEVLLRFQGQKKIKHIGLCNVGLDLLKKAIKAAPVRSVQVQYSLLERGIEKELLPFCIAQKIGVIAYGVMGGGILTGKYKVQPQFTRRDARKMFYSFYEGEKFTQTNRFIKSLSSYGRPLNELALNWCRQQQGVVVALAGCRDAEQLRMNAGAASWDLSVDEISRLNHMEGA
jgi:methylglyoxal reductase